MPAVSNPKKILFYNWVQFDDPDNLGGGVNVYQKNLINELIKTGRYDIYFLSSGTHYDLFRKKIRIEKTPNIFEKKCHTFRIVNSPCTAPMSTMYSNLDTFINDTSLYNVVKSFINTYGNFDIIHFNNIEGLSSKCLKLKKDFPKTKFIYTIHNYTPFTPEANMFYLSENEKYKSVRPKANQKQSILFYKLDTKLRKIGLSSLSAKIFKVAKGYISKGKKHSTSSIHIPTKSLLQYQKANVNCINLYMDQILAVSNRTRDIAISFGIDENKIKTEYIGTTFADNAPYVLHKKPISDYFTIAYMGYFDKAKGFDFLVDALSQLDEDVARKINFLCYAKVKNSQDQINVSKIHSLSKRLHSVSHYDGYLHSDLSNIMKKIDLGIVPVIWEDNLPQVAIEYAAHGVPVLASNLGGAHELSSSSKFIFTANDTRDFTKKLSYLVNHPETLNEYFAQAMHLTTLSEHITNLEKHYETPKK